MRVADARLGVGFSVTTSSACFRVQLADGHWGSLKVSGVVMRSRFVKTRVY
jgi:hypothetical protein